MESTQRNQLDRSGHALSPDGSAPAPRRALPPQKKRAAGIRRLVDWMTRPLRQHRNITRRLEAIGK